MFRIFQNLSLTILMIIMTPLTGSAQTYQWPCAPFDQQHFINGTFCENRTGADGLRDHFHDGVDIHLLEGGTVYSVVDGQIDGYGGLGTINSWVRVGNYAYVHVDINPALGIGDPVVAFETIIGTTNSWNHIHFKDGQPGSEINALRDGGGLSPFVDNYDPTIDFVNFYIEGTTTQFTNQKVFGRIEIAAKARDKTDEGAVGDNNGIYSIGYQVFDSSGTIPLSNPVEHFVFDVIPASDNYITNVYFPGSDLSTYIYTITNRITSNGFWDTDQLDKGTYRVQVFTEDTRSNTSFVWRTVQVSEPDYTAPAMPQLKSLTGNDNNQWSLDWMPNDSLDLAGYQFLFSLDGQNWTINNSISNQIAAIDTSYLFDSFPNNSLIYFRLLAYDDSPFINYSDTSDSYGLQLSSAGARILIVDGFDRTDGYWIKPSHQFVNRYGGILSDFNLSFNTCSDEAIVNGRIILGDYEIVIYLLGDEAAAFRSLTITEQQLIKDYLQGGGKLIISGSEIGHDIQTYGSIDEKEFYQSYLKSSFVADSAGSHQVTGAAGTVFADYQATIAPPLDRIYRSDIIQAYNGSTLILTYPDGNGAGIYYNGLFEDTGQSGQLAYFSFPIELIANDEERKGLLGRMMGLFGVVSSIDNQQSEKAPVRYHLYQNYPNPFNPSTVIRYQLAESGHVKLEIFSVTGKKVKTLFDQMQVAGKYQLTWNGTDQPGQTVSSGVYVYRLSTNGQQISRKMLLLR